VKNIALYIYDAHNILFPNGNITNLLLVIPLKIYTRLRRLSSIFM